MVPKPHGNPDGCSPLEFPGRLGAESWPCSPAEFAYQTIPISAGSDGSVGRRRRSKIRLVAFDGVGWLQFSVRHTGGTAISRSINPDLCGVCHFISCHDGNFTSVKISVEVPFLSSYPPAWLSSNFCNFSLHHSCSDIS